MGELMGGGKLDVEGPRTRIALVRAMVDQLDDDVQPSDLLQATVRVVFGQVMNVPNTDRPAAGDTQSATHVRIRHGIMGAADLRPTTVMYTACHEVFGHARLLQRPLSDSQKRRCLELLDGPDLPPFNNPNEVWKKVPGENDYFLRPYECIIDGMVEAISDVESPFQRLYRRRIRDLSALKDIWLEGGNAPPDPPDPPEPLPPPPDLVMENAKLKLALGRVREIVADEI